MNSSVSLSGLGLALGSASLYGLNIAYARLASFAGISGSTLVVYRVFLMLILIGAFALAARRSLKVAIHERGIVAVLGVSTTLIGVCYLSSVAFIPVTVAVALFYTFPIVIVLANPLVEGTRLTPALLGIAGVALAGVVLVVGPAFQDLDWRGIALAMAASLAAATQFFAGARCRSTGMMAKILWIHLLVLPTAAIIAVVTGGLAPPSALALAPYPVAMTTMGYILGFVLQFMALGRIPAVAAGIVFCAEPVVAVLSSTIILGEALAPIQYVGGVLVLTAIITNIVATQRRSKTAQPIVPSAD